MDRALEAFMWAFVVDAPLVVLGVAGFLIRDGIRHRRRTVSRLTAARIAEERAAAALAAADAVRGVPCDHAALVISAPSRAVHGHAGNRRDRPHVSSRHDSARTAVR